MIILIMYINAGYHIDLLSNLYTFHTYPFNRRIVIKEKYCLDSSVVE